MNRETMVRLTQDVEKVLATYTEDAKYLDPNTKVSEITR